MRPIIGISGHLGSGKDTAADYLVENYGCVKQPLAKPIKEFAKKVFHFTDEQLYGPSDYRNELDPRFVEYDKERDTDDAWMAAFYRLEKYGPYFCLALFETKSNKAFMDLKHWLQNLAEKHPQISPRIVLQSLGTEWGRTIDNDVWVKYAIRKANALIEAGHRGVVIPDIRFQNEVAAVKRNNGFLVRIKRPSTDLFSTKVGITGHASEAEQQNFTDNQFNLVINNDKSINDLLQAVDVIGYMLPQAQE